MMPSLPTLAAVSASLMLGAGAPPAAPLQPTGKWVVNFDDAQCLAERDYGTGDNQLRLVFKQPPLGSVMQIAVVGSGGRVEPQQHFGSIAFDGQPPLKTTVLNFRPEDAKYGVHLINVPAAKFAAARNAKTVQLKAGKLQATFALTGLGALSKVMDECVADLRRVWNVADAGENGRPLHGNKGKGLAGLFGASDYPLAALLDNQAGATKIALLVDGDGKVADCSVVETSGVAILDSQSCAVVRKRAQFEPARDDQGKPRKSAFLQQIVWRMMMERAPFR